MCIKINKNNAKIIWQVNRMTTISKHLGEEGWSRWPSEKHVERCQANRFPFDAVRRRTQTQRTYLTGVQVLSLCESAKLAWHETGGAGSSGKWDTFG